MPYLSDEDRERYAKDSARTCPECKRKVYNVYCSKCDEFYPVGHPEGCKLREVHKHN